MNSVKMIFLVCLLLLVGQLEGGSIIKDYDEGLGKYLKEILENFRDLMKDGIPEIGVPITDPLDIQDIDETISDEFADLNLRMKNIRIMNLSNFTIKSIKADIIKTFVSVHFSLPKLHAEGVCYINGKVLSVFPLSANGNFSIDVEDVIISGQGLFHVYELQELGNDTKSVKIRLSDLMMDLTFGPLVADFENIIGADRWAEPVLKILRGKEVGMFQAFHQTAMNKLDKILIKIINEELDKFELKKFIQSI